MTENKEIQFFTDEELPRGHVAGRSPLPRPWVKVLKTKPRRWGLIEQHQDPKRAMGRANSHRIWANKNKVPIEVISRTLPGNWRHSKSLTDPTPNEGFVFARWMKAPRKKKTS